MMWRAILVDDEEFVRAELAALFPWEEHQFTLLGEAENSQAAMALVEKERPDLVITDIRMPESDGLTLISWLCQRHPRIAAAVVSAYDDFPYVREALRLGAVDYLVKAEATAATAGAFLARMRGILESRHSDRHEREELHNNAARYRLLAVESFWRDLLTRASDEDELAMRAGQLGIVTVQTWFGLIFLHVRHGGEQRGETGPALRVALEEEIQALWDWQWTWRVIDLKRGNYLIVAEHACGRPEAEAPAKLREIARQLAHPGPAARTTSASGEVCLLAGLPGSFREVREANLLRLYGGEGEFIPMEALHRLRQTMPPKIPELLAAWEQALRMDGDRAVQDFLGRVCQEILPACLGPEEAMRLVLDLIHTLRRVSFEHQLRWEEIDSRARDLPEILEQAETVDDWQRRLEELATGYKKAAKTVGYPQISAAIRKALIYIQANFTRDLSLDEVARQAGVSRSYLSRVFPDYTGQHFSDYVQKLRLERAKELLRFTNEHIYEIAAQVGFWNSRYFSRVFHDAIGMTPADYRRLPQEAKMRC